MAAPRGGDLAVRQGPAEWPGAVCAKFKAGKRAVACAAKEGEPTSLARQGFGNYFTDSAGLALKESKRIVGCQSSDEFDWRPCKKALPIPGGESDEKWRGKKTVPAPVAKEVVNPEKRHFRQVECKEEQSDLMQGKRLLYKENGLRVGDQPAREVDLSDRIQRKVKGYDLLRQRNGVGCCSYGDKNYRHPEYDNKFFTAGGLVVGSSFHRGTYKRHEPRNALSADFAFVPRSEPTKSYEEKQRELEVEYARHEVQELTQQWEVSTLKETSDAKYEELSDSEAEGGEDGAHVAQVPVG